MAESGDTYANEGDPAAPEGMGDEPDLLERAQKVGHASYTAAAACYFPAATRRALMLHLLHMSSSFVLHAWQEPFNSSFSMLQLLIGVDALWLLSIILPPATAPGKVLKVPRCALTRSSRGVITLHV